MKKKIRKTPFDDPSLKQVWKKEHAYNINKLGLSNRESWRRISAEYGCSTSAASYWTNPKIRLKALQIKKQLQVPYSDQSSKRINYLRLNSRLRGDIQRNPNIYLSEIFIGSETFPGSPEPKSLEQICHCLHQGTGIRIRSQTFTNYVKNWEYKNKTSLLEKIPGSEPAQYRLNL